MKTKANNKPWQVRNVNGQNPEILIYGDIEDFKIINEDVTAREFYDELQNLGDVEEIDLRINSRGGSVWAANAIYTQLISNKAKINVYVDGLAASAASLISMAGNKIYMPENAMMMIHNPRTIAIGDTEEMMKVVEMLEQIEKTMVSAYKAKTGKDEQEIDRLMEEETWLTGAEAVEMGFADEVLQAVEVAASLENNQLVINGVTHDLSYFSKTPQIKSQKSKQFAAATAKPDQQVQNNKGVGAMNITVDEIRNNYPDVFDAIKKEGYDEGAQAENKRIKAIEDLHVPGNDELITKAKFETMATAEQVAMDIIKAQKEKGQTYLSSVESDAKESGVENVEGSDAPEGGGDKEQKAVEESMVQGANKKRGVK